jgi:hypothetical protein
VWRFVESSEETGSDDKRSHRKFSVSKIKLSENLRAGTEFKEQRQNGTFNIDGGMLHDQPYSRTQLSAEEKRSQGFTLCTGDNRSWIIFFIYCPSFYTNKTARKRSGRGAAFGLPLHLPVFVCICQPPFGDAWMPIPSTANCK